RSPPRGLEIDDQFEVGRLLDRNVGWLDATQHLDGRSRRLAEDAGQANAISYEAAFFRHFSPLVNGRKPQRGGTSMTRRRLPYNSGDNNTLIAAAPDVLISFLAGTMSSGVRMVTTANSTPCARAAS